MLVLHLPTSTTAAATLGDFLVAWQFEPLPGAALIVLGWLYVTGWRRLVRLGGRADARRSWAFGAAFVALALALLSPLHSFAGELFFVHMVQHVLLMSVAAPLLLLSNPMPVILWSLPPGWRSAAGRALAPDAPAVGVLRLLTRPPVAWLVFALNLWLWHLPAAYQAALVNEPLHYVQHLCFFLSAVLFWWPVIGAAPVRSRLSYPLRMLYVFLAWLPNTLLGAVITFAPAPWMPSYGARPRHWGIDPLADQQLAGLLMWIPGDLIYAAAMLVLLLAALRQEDRREARSAAA